MLEDVEDGQNMIEAARSAVELPGWAHEKVHTRWERNRSARSPGMYPTPITGHLSLTDGALLSSFPTERQTGMRQRRFKILIKASDETHPRAAGGIKFPPLRFVEYLRNLMSYERETWHSFK